MRIVFLLFENDCTNLQNKKSIEGARGQIIESSNQSAFPEDKKTDRPIRLLWQDKQVGQTNQSFSTDHLSGSANQILWTDYPTDHLSLLANQILQTDFPTDHLSVSANQILRMDLPTEHLSISANQIPTEHLPYRPIISFGVSSAEITKRSIHLNGHGPHELTRSRSPSLSTTRHSNDLRSHERDGWNLKNKWPRAKVVLSRTH